MYKIRERTQFLVSVKALSITFDHFGIIMAEHVSVKEDDVRLSWKAGSMVEIYSVSSKQWHQGTVMKILNDEEGEWLEVQYKANNMKRVKETPREDEYTIRPIGPTTEHEAELKQRQKEMLEKELSLLQREHLLDQREKELIGREHLLLYQSKLLLQAQVTAK
eukprot:245441_1